MADPLFRPLPKIYRSTSAPWGAHLDGLLSSQNASADDTDVVPSGHGSNHSPLRTRTGLLPGGIIEEEGVCDSDSETGAPLDKNDGIHTPERRKSAHAMLSDGVAGFKFVAAKERVNAELREFREELAARIRACKAAPQGCEEEGGKFDGLCGLHMLSAQCLDMAPDEFCMVCEGIVGSVHTARLQLSAGPLKSLHTRLLFILTRCTRLLQLQKESHTREESPRHCGFSGPLEPVRVRTWAPPPSPARPTGATGAWDGSPKPVDNWRLRDPQMGGGEWKGPVGDGGVGGAGAGAGQAALLANRLAAWKKSSTGPPPARKSRLAGGSMGAGEEMLKAVVEEETGKQAGMGSRLGMGLRSEPSIEVGGGDEDIDKEVAAAVAVDTWDKDEEESNKGTGEGERRSKGGRGGKRLPLKWGYWGEGGSDPMSDSEYSVLCRICEEDVDVRSLEDHSRLCALAEECDCTEHQIDTRLKRLAEELERMAAAEAVRMGVLSRVYGREGGPMPTHSASSSATSSPAGGGGFHFPSASSEGGSPRSGTQDDAMQDGFQEIREIEELAIIAHDVADVSPSDNDAEEFLQSCAHDLSDLLNESCLRYLTIETFGPRVKSLIEDKAAQLRQAGDAGSEYGEEEEEGTPLHPHAGQRGQMSIEDFEIMKPISRGAFGRVFLGRKRTTGDLFAIKVVRKADMLRKNAGDSVQAERNILVTAQSPFVVRFFYSFSNRNNLYLVMEYLNGGDLFSLLRHLGCLEEGMARGYVAELVLALDYLHTLGVVHRDLKPDNLLIAHDGHLKLTDFGLSRMGLITSTAALTSSPTPVSEPSSPGPTTLSSPHWTAKSPQWVEGESRGAVGTPDYLAPEILLGTGHGFTADWWSVGVIIFEFLTGMPPFNAPSPESIFDNILSGVIPWPRVPEDMSVEAHDLITRLLHADPRERLGYRGAGEVKAHPFFADVRWDSVVRDKAAFVPVADDPHDTSYFQTRGDGGDGEASDGKSDGDGSASTGTTHFAASESEHLNDFTNFFYKNNSQLASINYNLLERSGIESFPSSPAREMGGGRAGQGSVPSSPARDWGSSPGYDQPPPYSKGRNALFGRSRSWRGVERKWGGGGGTPDRK